MAQEVLVAKYFFASGQKVNSSLVLGVHKQLLKELIVSNINKVHFHKEQQKIHLLIYRTKNNNENGHNCKKHIITVPSQL